MDTTNLDDLLNQAEAQETSNDEWVLDFKYETKDFYVDEHGAVEIKNKTIGDMSKHISVKGESYSQYVEFKMNRYYDGVDLTKMTLAIYFDIPGIGQDENRPVNVYYNSNEIKFGWAVPVEVSQVNLTIDLCIYVRGVLSDGKNYLLKTKTAKYTINDGLELGSGVIQPTNNWYTNFVFEMDSKVKIATDAAVQSLNSSNVAKESESVVLQSKQVIEEKSDAVNKQYVEVQTMHRETKSYRDESEQFRNQAEQFRNQAEVITGIGLAEEGKPGIVQPDGVTTKVTEDGKLVVIGGGGGGTSGTTDYQALENKPSIAGIELNGDKSYDELGLASKEAVARNFDAVNQELEALDTFTQQLDQDISTLDTELEQANQQLQSTTDKVDEVQSDIESGFKKDAQGEEIHLTNAVDGKTVTLSLFGKSEQKTLSGKNLIPYPHNESNKTRTGVTFTDNGDGTVHVNGTNTKTDGTAYLFLIGTNDNYVLAKGTYVISGTPTENNTDRKCWLSVTRNSDSARLGADKGNGATFTLEEDTQIRIEIIVDASATANNLTFKPMLRLASIEDDTYEPYTGGYPSPNPEYPQPIESSGGKGFVEVKSVGKNLIPYPYQGTSYSVDDGGVTVLDDGGIKFLGTTTVAWWFAILNNQSNVNPYYLPKGTYTLSVESTTTANPISIGLIDVSDGSSIITMNLVGSMYKEVTFTIDEDANIAIRTFIGVGKTVDTIIYPMLRLASDTDNTYEPYKETKSIILTPNGLSGIKVDTNGNYTDENGQQWITDKIIRYADGSGEYIQRVYKHKVTNVRNYNAPRVFIALPKTMNMYDTTSNIYSMCNRFTAVKHTGIIVSIDNSCGGQEGTYGFRSDSLGFTTAEEWQTWFAENETIIHYVLAEPIINPLTVEQLVEIEKLQTFSPVTNISNDSDCGMSITYGTTQEILMLQEALNGSKANAQEIANVKEEIVDIKKELSDTTFKVDTIIEKADLGIKETASGEEIHLTDSAEGKAVEFALFGKAKQKTTTGKNLITYPYNETTHTENGITWTDNGDGTITANGTATADATFYLDNDFTLKAGSYILSGCPSGGSTTSYRVQLANNSWNIMFADKGDGASVVLEEDTVLQQFRILIPKGMVVNNLVFKPMIRLASITDDTWEQPTNGATPRPDYTQEIEVAGESYNLIPYPYYETTKEANGVLFTLNENDGSIVVNGTATANGSFIFNHRIDNTMILGAGEYKVSGCPSGGSDTTYRLIVGKTSSAGSFEVVTKDLGSGAIFTLTEDTDVYVAFEVLNGATLSNLVVRPMIHKASVKNNRYMPYGKGSVEVKSVGKNLYDRNKDLDRTNVGVTATISDGVMVLNGTATGNGALPAVGEEVNILNAKVGETFTLSVKILDGNANIETKTSLAYLSFRTKSGLNELTKTGSVTANENNVDKNTETSSITFTVTENMFNEDGEICVLCTNYIRGTEVFNNLKIGVQLEKGDKATEFQLYKESVPIIPTPNGLAGIKVSSGGNYTDSNGQQWICDEVVKYADGSGAYIQRLGKLTLDGTEAWQIYDTLESGKRRFVLSLNTLDIIEPMGKTPICMCSHFLRVLGAVGEWGSFVIDGMYLLIHDKNGTKANLNDFKNYLAECSANGNAVAFYYPIQPITTPLTAEQLAEIEKLSTFYPVTNISNDAGCGMKVTYLADSKNYIDNKLALQAKAREEEMMAMFLLLPDEVQAAMIDNDTNNLMSGMEE